VRPTHRENESLSSPFAHSPLPTSQDPRLDGRSESGGVEFLFRRRGGSGAKRGRKLFGVRVALTHLFFFLLLRYIVKPSNSILDTGLDIYERNLRRPHLGSSSSS
jgi:hypothetical protein